MSESKVDFIVTNHGTVWQFQPVSETAKAFSETELGLEGWQWHGNTFVVDHRPAHSLFQALIKDGFLCESGG